MAQDTPASSSQGTHTRITVAALTPLPYLARLGVDSHSVHLHGLTLLILCAQVMRDTHLVLLFGLFHPAPNARLLMVLHICCRAAYAASCKSWLEGLSGFE
jgi:hypothetical protein